MGGHVQQNPPNDIKATVVWLVSAPLSMFVEQKMVRNPHNKDEAKTKGIPWPLIGFLRTKKTPILIPTQLLVCFANTCYMSDYQIVLALKSVAETT
jgi:hypothetical protein